MKPLHKVNAGIHELLWEQEQLAARVDRIRERSDEVWGEIVLKTLLPGVPPLLHQARLNLTSTTARRSLVRHLEERYGELLPGQDWGTVVEQACVMVLDAHRQGEPLLNLHKVPPRSGPRWRLEPVLLEGHPNHLFGDGGVGKSYLAAYFGVLVSSGFRQCALSPSPGNVLVLDYETSGEEFKERVERIEAGLGEPDCSNLLYRFCVQPVARDIEQLQAIVAENEIELVIVDSMGPACAGNPNDPEPVIEYFRALRSLRCCTLTVDHVAKGATAQRTPFGTVYKTNLSRNVFELRKAQEVDEARVTLGLFHRKANFGQLLPAMGFRLTFTRDAVYFAPTKVRHVPALMEAASARERIVGFLLQEGATSANDIAQALKLSPATVRARLSEGRGKVFTQVGVGPLAKWAALAAEEEE